MKNNIRYIGCDDKDLQLFESQYFLPNGMCYNSYVAQGEKIAVMDTVDSRCTEEWMYKLQTVLAGKTPDYVVVQHVEPDHSGSLSTLLAAYPNLTVVCSAKAQTMIAQFGINAKEVIVVKEGDTLDLGGLTLRFIMAPMVHWPEVMMTYAVEAQTLFSADAFGKFGVYDADKDDWACEARRYYFNICGKYGTPVSTVLKKASALTINTICPLHGPVLEGEQLQEAMRLYNIWSGYGVETKGVLIAHASIHGNTARAAERLAQMLREKGEERVVVADLCRDDMAEVIEDAFRMDRMVVCASSYDNNVFPPMHTFLWKLQQKAYQNRTVGIVENGSWAPSAGREMKALLETMKNITIVEPMVTIKSTLNAESEAQLKALAQAI
ncbi:MAG: FprA family A-type flavoprotein [Paludibacteraceae bacterium]|nr:FprA family A-type flavoprotein [Paludibacteraceae bacterium]